MNTILVFRNPFFYRTILFILLAELFSLFGFLVPAFSAIAFFTIVVLAIALTLYKFPYGIFLLFVELFIGSKGFLFSWDGEGISISLRIALWLIVMAVWCARLLFLQHERQWLWAQLHRSMIRWYIGLLIVIALVTIHGLLRNAGSDVFFDMNAWLFFLLLFPVCSALRTRDDTHTVFSLLIAATAWTSIKALVVLFVYAHDPLGGVFLPLYHWIRDTGVGEVTAFTARGIPTTFARVFFQSQLYTLIAFFLLLGRTRVSEERKLRITHYALLVIYCASLLLSLSRSFWLAGIVAFVWSISALLLQKKIRAAVFSLMEFFSVSVVAILLVWSVMNFPYPKTDGGSFVSLIGARATDIEEAGLGSRWSLLPPLWERISAHWLLGEGFGATVTYRSYDPRIVQSSARGNNFYTTYAFEWGYLDLWLKLGLMGIAVYGMMLWRIAQRVTGSLFFAFLVLLMTHIFSPYLNHPLGIGFILFCIAIILSEHYDRDNSNRIIT